jgi:hypothetical protein
MYINYIHAQTPESSFGYPPTACVTTMKVECFSTCHDPPRYPSREAEEAVSECFINVAVSSVGRDGRTPMTLTGSSNAS